MSKYRGAESKLDVVRDWFLANPGEYLTVQDMREKFDISPIYLKNVMLRLRAEGIVKTELMNYLNPDRPRGAGGA